MRKKLFKILTSISAFAVVVIVIALHANRRPFIRTDDYSAAVWHSGMETKAEVYKAAFMKDVYYLKIQGNDRERYSWIVFHPARKAVMSPVGLYHSMLGYAYTHSDQGFGIDLTDAKLEDDWRVVFTEAGIHMANTTLRVEITP